MSALVARLDDAGSRREARDALIALGKAATGMADRGLRVLAFAYRVLPPAYVLADAPGGAPQVLLMATGSEVALAVSAHEALAREGVQ